MGRSERLSPAAIRVPKGSETTPSSPKLFIDEGARQALERKLRVAHSGHAVVVSINDNRHSIISHHVQSGVLYARVHHMFLDAPPDVMDALAAYLTDGDPEADDVVGSYIERMGARLAKRKPDHSPYPVKGDSHDLTEIYDSLNNRYFNGNCHALIAWGRYRPRKKGQPRKTLRLGNYFPHDQLIRIHPVLDQPWVPRYFISSVVYHEMLHHELQWVDSNRRCLHPPEFVERERQFHWYARAAAWEQKNLNRLLRSS